MHIADEPSQPFVVFLAHGFGDLHLDQMPGDVIGGKDLPDFLERSEVRCVDEYSLCSSYEYPLTPLFAPLYTSGNVGSYT